MKKLSILFLAFSFLLTSNIKAQSFDISMLDDAMGLLTQGKQKESGQILGTAMNLLSQNTSATSGDFASKILGQTNSLTALIPALMKGNADITSVQGIIQTIKMLYGAMNLNQMVKSGSLMGNSAALLSNVELLKGGLSMLEGGGTSVTAITKSLDKIVKKAPKLEKTGFFGKMANKAVTKKLESSLGLLNGLI